MPSAEAPNVRRVLSAPRSTVPCSAPCRELVANLTSDNFLYGFKGGPSARRAGPSPQKASRLLAPGK